MGAKLVAGLGNYEKRYEGTRHNMGFRVVDEVARRLRVAAWRRQCASQVGTARMKKRWYHGPRSDLA